MEVSKFDMKELDNCCCENCRCERFDCHHDERTNADKKLDLINLDSTDVGQGGAMWSKGGEQEKWKMEQCEYGDWDEDDLWVEVESGNVNEYTGVMEGVRKVRCDQDDVNGVALRDACLDDELEKWLEPLMIEDKLDLPKNGIGEFDDASMAAAAPVDDSFGMLVVESVDALENTPASIDGSGGVCVDKTTSASMAAAAPVDGGINTFVDDTLVITAAPLKRLHWRGYINGDRNVDKYKSMSASLDELTPTIADRDAWVARFCTPAAPVQLQDIGVDVNNMPRWEKVLEMAHAAEKLAVGDIFVTPPKMTKAELLRFYANNHCRCARSGGAVCGYCASGLRIRARRELKEGGQKGEEVKKTLFKGDDGECD